MHLKKLWLSTHLVGEEKLFSQTKGRCMVWSFVFFFSQFFESTIHRAKRADSKIYKNEDWKVQIPKTSKSSQQTDSKSLLSAGFQPHSSLSTKEAKRICKQNEGEPIWQTLNYDCNHHFVYISLQMTPNAAVARGGYAGLSSAEIVSQSIVRDRVGSM